jgi:DNA-binding GntR family transcriptional regulator
VREALRRLAALGLVTFEPNRGVRVRTLTRAELREAFIVRAELESLATEVAVERFTDDDLRELEDVEARFAALTDALRSRTSGEDARERLVGDWVRANHAFHDVIYRVAGLPLVERMAKSARFSARRAVPGERVPAPRDHRVDPSPQRRRRPRARARARGRVREPARAHRGAGDPRLVRRLV